MIYFDVTKSGSGRHHSGLQRLSGRLREELGAAGRPVRWDAKRHHWRAAGRGAPVALAPADWLLTAEQFSEAERPGFWEFLRARPCRLGAIFCDAIPLQLPHITWPQSVARHPEYIKMLAGFDRVWAISAASRDVLAGFWRWQETAVRAALDVLALGADFDGRPRSAAPAAPPAPRILTVGIVEPRKNQGFLLDVAEELWAAGLDFALDVVGRVNPHFGRPIAARLKARAKTEPRLRYHAAASDVRLERLYTACRVTAFSTIAEGHGLPVLESLWKGRPCVCSDLPVLHEVADGGGCVMAAPGDRAAWAAALRAVLTDDAEWGRLAAEAAARVLPTWADAANSLRRGLI
jgi:glycosyltransferase involved in cell wall biosynthesis